MNPQAQKIIDECKLQFQIAANKKDCNKFVKAVSNNFGITLNGIADDIVDQIQGDGWTL